MSQVGARPAAITSRLNPAESINHPAVLGVENPALPNSSATQPHVLAYSCACNDPDVPQEAVELL